MVCRFRKALSVLLAVWMIAGVVLHAPMQRLLPARSTALGGDAAFGVGYPDCHAVVPGKPGQPFESRGRWEPTPGAACLHDAARVVPLVAAVSGPGVGRGAVASAVCRSRVCCWLL